MYQKEKFLIQLLFFYIQKSFLLKKYFSQFFWYIPISKDVKVSAEEAETFREKTDAIIEVRKETKQYLAKDLGKYSKEELRYIRNLPYALRGYSFKDENILTLCKLFWGIPFYNNNQ